MTLSLMMMISMKKNIPSLYLCRGSSRGMRWAGHLSGPISKLWCLTTLRFIFCLFHVAGANPHPLRQICLTWPHYFSCHFVTRSVCLAVSGVHHGRTRRSHAQSMPLPRVLCHHLLLPDSLAAGGPTTGIEFSPRQRIIITRPVKVSYDEKCRYYDVTGHTLHRPNNNTYFIFALSPCMLCCEHQ